MINSFRNEYAFLSNFQLLVNPIHWFGINYRTSEHFFVAMKTLRSDERMWIASLDAAWKAKRAGGKYGFEDRRITIRTDWDIIRYQVMRTALTLKFSNNPDLMYKLCATGSQQLTEGNTWHDNTWGICSCVGCTNILGQNWLGILLMELIPFLQAN